MKNIILLILMVSAFTLKAQLQQAPYSFYTISTGNPQPGLSSTSGWNLQQKQTSLIPNLDSVTIAQIATIFRNNGPYTFSAPAGHDLGTSVLTVSMLCSNGLSTLNANGPLTEQHDGADRVTFFRSDYTQSAGLSSTGMGGLTSFSLKTCSAEYPTNLTGEYTINQPAGGVMGVFTDSLGNGRVGWANASSNSLYLDGGRVLTSASFQSGSFIQSRTALIASYLDSGQVNLPTGTLGYFYSKRTALTTVSINNQSFGIGSAAGLTMNAGGSQVSIYSYASNNGLGAANDGTLVVETTNARGIWFNANSANSTDNISIGFAVRGLDIARFGNEGDFVIGPYLSDPSSILTINSTKKGFRLPKMTALQMMNIPDPGEGLEIYNTTLHKICFFDGTQWQVEPSYAFSDRNHI